VQVILMSLLSWFRNRPEDVNSTIDRLTSGSEQDRAEAIRDLKRHGASALEPLLLALFLADDIAIPWIGKAFHEIGDAGLTVLRRALEHPGYEARRSAVKALEIFGAHGNGAVRELVRCLEDVDPEVRWRSARVLGLIGPSALPALTALKKCCGSSDQQLSLEAKSAIQSISPSGSSEKEP
jgi:HEAT repeat protein